MNAGNDTVFDGIAGTFSRTIYWTTKGRVRLAVLWQDLVSEVPILDTSGLRVIDVGAGMGQVATRIAGLGHHVTLCDPSQEMLDSARAALEREGVLDRANLVRSTAQDLDTNDLGRFDLVICHAVLEWLADPKPVLEHVLDLMKPEGYLSLMFYNRNASLLKQIVRGDFRRTGSRAAVSRAALPKARSLDPEVVRSWLVYSGLRVESKAGIRIFHDHIPEETRSPDRLDDLIATEIEFSRVEPFASLGQHVHFICRRGR